MFLKSMMPSPDSSVRSKVQVGKLMALLLIAQSVSIGNPETLQPLSSNVLPIEDDFLDNKFSASASFRYKTDCLLGSGWEDESSLAGRSTEDASFRESLELDHSANVMHERRKPFMRNTEA
ncbi:uncharacterized protein LOC129872094 [Solanum dulcamara]|uniref:uncharacterized protein LOC129872094 n=1 Tax=Solanum dulcamara TaxID=45834 RepID=UPI0024854A50|nr:uncharacterized protein LOC129872094 [Solanum dulcamara]